MWKIVWSLQCLEGGNWLCFTLEYIIFRMGKLALVDVAGREGPGIVTALVWIMATWGIWAGLERLNRSCDEKHFHFTQPRPNIHLNLCASVLVDSTINSCILGVSEHNLLHFPRMLHEGEEKGTTEDRWNLGWKREGEERQLSPCTRSRVE